ncbi:RING-2 protein [Pyricularia oryzae Y34]|uniref:Methylated-DNA--protein-cysteine methyltransferase n=1 Tax=Pyricularia oryzae (strain Y34) TaxID=1143189 RepID=A0AA97NZK4_PYRO3|nr:RING-2 protein [Pyricularia oryzae Y34]
MNECHGITAKFIEKYGFSRVATTASERLLPKVLNHLSPGRYLVSNLETTALQFFIHKPKLALRPLQYYILALEESSLGRGRLLRMEITRPTRRQAPDLDVSKKLTRRACVSKSSSQRAPSSTTSIDAKSIKSPAPPPGPAAATTTNLTTTTTTKSQAPLFPTHNDMQPQLDLIAASSRTAFEKKVWSLLCQIPSGSVSTYGIMSAHLGSSPRAVGNALRRNPFAPEVPCHRVVATGGALGGFKGKWPRDGEGITLDEKRLLLRREGVRFDDAGARILGTPFSGFR